jgi:hypothetical protein
MSIRCPGLANGGQFGGHDHGGGIAQVGLTPGGSGRPSLPETPRMASVTYSKVVVAGALQADNHAIAGQLVGAHAFELAEIADALGMGGLRGAKAAARWRARE